MLGHLLDVAYPYVDHGLQGIEEKSFGGMFAEIFNLQRTARVLPDKVKNALCYYIVRC